MISLAVDFSRFSAYIIIMIKTETETVIKKIIPYLHCKGYIDILVTLGKTKPSFLIEVVL